MIGFTQALTSSSSSRCSTFDFSSASTRLALLVEVLGALGELRLGDTGRAVAAEQVAVLVLAEDVVEEDVLGDDGIAFHPEHFGDVGDAARTVAETGGLHDDVDRGDDHLADGAARAASSRPS